MQICLNSTELSHSLGWIIMGLSWLKCFRKSNNNMAEWLSSAINKYASPAPVMYYMKSKQYIIVCLFLIPLIHWFLRNELRTERNKINSMECRRFVYLNLKNRHLLQTPCLCMRRECCWCKIWRNAIKRTLPNIALVNRIQHTSIICRTPASCEIRSDFVHLYWCFTQRALHMTVRIFSFQR